MPKKMTPEEIELADQIISKLFQEEQMVEMLIAWMRIFAQ